MRVCKAVCVSMSACTSVVVMGEETDAKSPIPVSCKTALCIFFHLTLLASVSVQTKYGLVVSNTIVLFEKRKVSIPLPMEFSCVCVNSVFHYPLISRVLPLNLLDPRKGLLFIVTKISGHLAVVF